MTHPDILAALARERSGTFLAAAATARQARQARRTARRTARPVPAPRRCAGCRPGRSPA